VRHVTLVCLAAAPCLSTTGCHREDPMAFEPRIAWSDIARGAPAADNRHVLLASERTQGRFACALAVAQAAAQTAPWEQSLDLCGPRHSDQAHWLAALAGLHRVRAVVFVTARDVVDQPGNVAGLCAAANRLGATLLLVYSKNRYAPEAAQALGLVYDVASGKPLAAVHASANCPSPDPDELVEDVPGDHRDVDASYQAARAFEARVRAALCELIELDAPPATIEPHNWTDRPDEPLWIPAWRERAP